MLRQPVSQEMATLAALPGQKSHQANSCIARSSSIEPMDVPRQFKKKETDRARGHRMKASVCLN